MGIDINYGEKSPVYPLKGGTVCDIIDINSPYSAIGIRSSFYLPETDTFQEYVIWYLHMKINENLSVNDTVTLNTKLGEISNKGDNIPVHLHIEV